PSPTVCSPPSSLATSSARARRRPHSATAVGASCWSAITSSYVANSCASAARRWTPRGTASSPPSTGRHVPSAAVAPSLKRCASSDWKSELAQDRKSTRLNSSHVKISYAVFCLKKKTTALSPIRKNLPLPLHLILSAALDNE